MKRVALVAVVSVVAVGGVPVLAQDWDKVEIKATHVAGSVHVLEGAGGNIGVSVGDDGILMVDDQFAPLADKVRAALRNIHGGDLEFILNTHWHGDHTNGNLEFGEDALILSHRNVRERLMVDQNLQRRSYEALDPSGWPVVTFEKAISIHFNGEEIRAVHYPASHTDGDAVIYFTGSKVVHLGDLLFADRFPFVDLETGGTVQGVIESLETVLGQLPGDTTFLSGHGGPINSADDVRRNLAMIKATAKIAQDWHARGLSLEDAQSEGLPDEYADYSWRFISTESWIETLYKSYER